MPKLRGALLVDGTTTPRWMADALVEAQARNLEVILILRCKNVHKPRQILRHWLYYVINLWMMRGPEESPVGLAELGLSGIPEHEFIAETEGAWQRFPTELKKVLADARCDLVIKTGMGLLRDPDDCGVKFGVLSFHHGDPSAFRGRPAGFYEILAGQGSMGVIVQRLSNRLDGGTILAFARSRVFQYSYRQTLAAARRSSRHLLWKAIDTAVSEHTIAIGTGGKNYRLPSFLTALYFLIRLAVSLLRRLLYGAFIEKHWQLSEVEFPNGVPLKGLLPIRSLSVPSRYVFLADSFYLPDGSIVAEAMRRSDGKGEIVRVLEDGTCHCLSNEPGRHLSYPFCITADGQSYLLPEVASWSAPFLQEIKRDGSFLTRHPLAGLERERLVDPTWIRIGMIDYIFAGKPGSEADHLHLWFSKDGIKGPYRAHPKSPVVIDSVRARMGGGFISQNGKLVRVGQDGTGPYGNGVTFCEVLIISEDEYIERSLGQIRVDGATGPHTYVVRGKRLLYDWYEDQFSMLAGIRRLMARS
jgi:hypothetical protein